MASFVSVPRFQRSLIRLKAPALLPLSLLLSVTLAGAPSQALGAGKHALLIGINRYASVDIPPLAGCVNDVEAMRQVLEARFGFPPANVKTLTNRQATRKAILSALQDLVANAQSGDEVYIHFSGHGSQVKDLDGDEKDDGLDETLLPYDARTNGVPDITDDEMNGILSGLRTEETLVVLDACHSGTATRSVVIRTRSVPADTRLGLYQAKKEGSIGTRSVSRDAEPRYVVMSATPPHESALDAEIEGVSRGIFSFALSTVLGVAETLIPPVRVITEAKKVLQTVQEKIGATQLPIPQLEGPAGQLQQALFGGLGAAAADGGSGQSGGPMSVRMAPLGPGTLLLVGGALAGATPGARWAVFPDGRVDAGPSAATVTAEVVALRGQDAEARVTPQDYVPGGAARAVAITSGASEPAVRVELRAPQGVAPGLQSAIQQRFAQVAFVGAQEFSTFMVDVAEPSGPVSVYGAGGLQLLDQFPWSQEADVAERVVPQLRRSFNADAIKSLSNPSTGIRLDVGVVGAAGGGGDPRGIQVVPSSDRARYRIRTTQEPRSSQNSLMLEIGSNVDCYLTIVDVDTEGRVTVLFPNPHQKSGFLPNGFVAAGGRSRIPDSLQEPNQAGFFWDYSPPAGLDVVQVFAASDLETATKLRTYLGAFADGSAGAVASRGVGSSAREGDPLSGLRTELAAIAVSRGISVVPSASGDATAASAPAGMGDWASVPVTITIEP